MVAAPALPESRTTTSDYEAELERIERALAGHRAAVLERNADPHERAMYAYRRYQHAGLTGDLVELEAVDEEIDHAISAAVRPDDLYVLKAKLALKLHRLSDVRRNLQNLAGSPACAAVLALWADLAFQEGRYTEAVQGLQDALEVEREWDIIARLAHVEAKLGDADRADGMFLEAEDELTAKEMRSYAWLELQRGVLDLTQGRLEEAGSHYQRASRAYSGYWLVDEHIAELLAAEGSLDDAIALYLDVIRRAPKPELKQSVGELYLMQGDAESARLWNEAARSEYLASTERGGVHYYHHLADFYSDVVPDGAEAVRWAARDWDLRKNFATQAALAWARYRNGQVGPAVQGIEAAVASGVKDAHLFEQAAAIHESAGHHIQAAAYSQRAAALNPRHGVFHAHR